MGANASSNVADPNNQDRELGFQSSSSRNPDLDHAPSDPDHAAEDRTLVIDEKLQHLDVKEITELVLTEDVGKDWKWDLKEAEEVLEGEKGKGDSNWEEQMGCGIEWNGWYDNGNENETVIEDRGEGDGGTITKNKFNRRRKNKGSKCRWGMGASASIYVADPNNKDREVGFQSSPSHNPDLDHVAEDCTLVIHEKLQHLDVKEISELVLKEEAGKDGKWDLKEAEEVLEGEKGKEDSNWEEQMESGIEWKGWDDNGNENEIVLEDRGERNGVTITKRHQYRYLKTGTCKFASKCKFNRPVRRINKAVKEKEESTKRPGQTECEVVKDKEKVKETEESTKMPRQTQCKAVKEKGKEKGVSMKRPGQTECKAVKEKEKEKEVSMKRPGQTECKAVKEKGKEKEVSTKRPGQTECKAVKEKGKEKEVSMKRPGQAECKAVKGKGKEKEVSTKRPGQTECKTVKKKVKDKGKSTKRPGQTECKSYLSSGVCKYGEACRHSHTRGNTSGTAVLELNFLDLPIRPGEKECPHYMRTGFCKHGANCWYNHPDPTAVGESDSPSGHGNGGSATLDVSLSSMPSWSSPRTLNETAPFVPLVLSPTHGVPPQNPEWNGYQASVCRPEANMCLPTYVMSPALVETNAYPHHQQQIQVEEYAVRPGQPECSYFLKTGDCKHKSNCKCHNPKDRIVKSQACTLNEKGLPLRPDQNICAQYSRYGICKFGLACIYDHPEHPG